MRLSKTTKILINILLAIFLIGGVVLVAKKGDQPIDSQNNTKTE